MRFLFMALAFVAGCVLPLQGSINGRLGKTIDNPVFASFFSFLIGTLALSSYVLIAGTGVKIQTLRSVQLYEWTGGILGAFYVLIVILMMPRLGAALTFSLIVAGQMVLSIVLDHVGFMGAAPHPANLIRLAGLSLIIVGVILVRKF